MGEFAAVGALLSAVGLGKAERGASLATFPRGAWERSTDCVPGYIRTQSVGMIIQSVAGLTPWRAGSLPQGFAGIWE